MKATKTYRLSFTEKAKNIVEQLSLEQKVWLMSGNIDASKPTADAEQPMSDVNKDDTEHYNVVPYAAGGLEKFHLPPMLFADGPRGVVCGNWQSTCFPVSMCRGATFDPDLEERIGGAIGKEVRAFGGNLFAGVCINMPYHPGWGRSQETYGEETYQIGQMGAALVRGVQQQDVMACVKHYAFNNMENARFKCSVTCDQRTEQEVFLPHFKDCIDAGAASIMSSYNRYNGVHCGHNSYLLRQVLKKEWDFDGFVMSDFCWGVRDTVEAANGGQDMEMLWTKYFGDRLVQAVRDGFVPMEAIDEAALRIVRTILAFEEGHQEYDMSVVGCPEHIALAKEAAEKGITLIKNESVLPLKRTQIRTLALIGRLADTAVIGDHGSSWVRPAYVVTPKAGLEAANPDCQVIWDDGSDLTRAKKLAAQADAVVFVVGCNHDDEGEYIIDDQGQGFIEPFGGDRKQSIGLHADEIKLLQEVGPVNQNSTAVLVGGNTIMMTEWYSCVPAILMAYYPGMEGGTALAEILYGDVNPSGKLPYVVPYQESDLPYVDWEATDQYYEYYHGYTRLEKHGVQPLVPYGFGLSYTTFSISHPTARVNGDWLEASVNVKNTGSRDGDEVVQLYVGFENSAVDRPVKQLRAFQRISLKAGEKGTVILRTPLEKLKWYHPTYRRWELEQMEYQIYIGSSADNKDLVKTTISL